MSIFFNLFSTGFSSLLYGLLITAFLMCVLFFILKMVSKGIVRSLAFYITGPFLFVILWINTTVFCGAWQIKNIVRSMELWLTQQLDGLNGTVDLKQSQEIGEELVDKFPVLGSFFGFFDFSGYSYAQLPSAMAGAINSELNSYMWSSFFWILGALFCASIIVMIFDKGKGRYSVEGNSRRGVRSSRRERYSEGRESMGRRRERVYSDKRRLYR